MAKRTTKKADKGQPYYTQHKDKLKEIIGNYLASKGGLFGTSDYAVFNDIQSNAITAYPPRSYQLEAMYVMDYILSLSATDVLKKDLLEIVDTETKKLAPFLSFEMATGSGKTMLMGSSIYLLNQKYNIKNFLIITPPSTDIYQKTIRNFSPSGYESVWAPDMPFTYNLITGDNYTSSLFYDETKDANIFIFNISKFGPNANKTDKSWESAIWTDDNGNQISIKQFLKDKKLVIITDEAHHAQAASSQKIIKAFHPDYVLEYTATAVEQSRGDKKKSQTIVYKYDIRRFLEDGHGKLVRAVALQNDEAKTKGGVIANNEKLKMITMLLIHLLKKEALLLDSKQKAQKALAFIKVKDDTKYTQRVFDYLQNDVCNDIENIEIILSKVKEQDIEITTLLQELFRDKYESNLPLLIEDIDKSVKTAIFYYGKSDKTTVEKFNNLRKNDVELVVYMQKLDEGIDFPNIYTMSVINDTETDFKTSVKQIIGRGVRLGKDIREFDEETNLLKANAEKLHIVCDRGKNFENVIEAIQKEFGLNDKYFSSDKPHRQLVNNVKSELLEGKYLPHIQADFKARQGVSLLGLVKDVTTVTQNYIEYNTFEGKDESKHRFLKLKPDGFFLEIDIFANKLIFHEKFGTLPFRKLQLTDKEQKAVYGNVQRNLYCLADTLTIRTAFAAYFKALNEIGLYYYHNSDADEQLAKKLFVSSFAFFYRNHIEKNFFQLDFRQISQDDSWNLKQQFKSVEIKIPEDQVQNNTRKKVKERSKLVDMVEAGYHFYGFEKSAYEYDKFDTYIEYMMADYANAVLLNINISTQPFWVRNQRNVHFTYGSKRYYPDFLVFKEGILYVIETKGEKYSNNKKNTLLRKLNEASGDETIKGFKGLLVFEQTLNRMALEKWDFDRFVLEVEKAEKRAQSLQELVTDPPEEQKFVSYLPVYSPKAAHGHFIKNNKTDTDIGWLQVPAGTYKDTIFVTQVKGNALSPTYEHNDWIILTHTKASSEAIDHVALVKNNAIKDEYDEKFAIRKVRMLTKQSSGLFSTHVAVLEALNPDIEPIEIGEIKSGTDVEVIGYLEEK
jgi:superfamily II DNA or RNA helicase